MVVNGKDVFINTGKCVSETKIAPFILPIKRTGPGIEDFEINFDVTTDFFNNKFTPEELQEELEKSGSNTIGPFKVKMQLYKSSSYRETQYPRMDLDELIETLVVNNGLLQNEPKDEIYLGNIKELRKVIKAKLQELPFTEFEKYQKIFSPLTEGEGSDQLVNYAADQKILNFINKKIESFQMEERFQEMPVEELEKELIVAIEKELYEISGKIRDIIDKKKGIIKKK